MAAVGAMRFDVRELQARLCCFLGRRLRSCVVLLMAAVAMPLRGLRTAMAAVLFSRSDGCNGGFDVLVLNGCIGSHCVVRLMTAVAAIRFRCPRASMAVLVSLDAFRTGSSLNRTVREEDLLPGEEEEDEALDAILGGETGGGGGGITKPNCFRCKSIFRAMY